MPRVISILSTIAAFGAAFAYALWPSARPHETDMRACSEDGQAQALQAQVSELEAARHRLEAEVEELRAINQPARDEAPAAEAPTSSPWPRPVATYSAPVLTHAQRVASVRQRNGALFREAGLTPEQTQAALDVLAQQAERTTSGTRRSMDPASRAEAAKRDHEELAQAIGEDKATQLDKLRETLGSRAELRRMRDDLEQAGEPLTEEQRQKLFARMSERPAFAPQLGGDRARFQESERQHAEQLRSDVASVLTPAQLQLFDQNQDLHRTYMGALRSPGPGSLGSAGSAAPAR